MKKYTSVTQRRKGLEQELKIQLPHISNYSIDDTKASTRNCENMIGTIQVPLGIAGPVVITNKTKREYMIPLATTEGALVASINRGCKALAANDGVTVISKKIGITRAPVFQVTNVLHGQQFVEWINKQTSTLKKITETTSHHLTLIDIKPWIVGRNVFLRFRFDSQEAMGMNMATIAVHEMSTFIENQTHIPCVALSGNMCVDKKPNFLNFIEGRGYTVTADAVITKETLQSILKTNAQQIVSVAQRKLFYGSVLSGSIGSNAHAANVLAAIFLATGQDVAHIAECATCVTTLEIHDDDGIYISVYLPDLVVGTIGGGTSLETQQEALSIMGITSGKKGSSLELAEVIAGAVLAGELSLLASLSEKSLAQAHISLARGKK